MTHHSHEHHHPSEIKKRQGKILTVRALSGLSGDMILSGLATMLGMGNEDLKSLIKNVNLEGLSSLFESCLAIETKSINAIAGFSAKVTLPHEHAHRTLGDIIVLIEKSHLTQGAKTLATETFTLLAKAEARVHQKAVEDVTFHEVGALDSILDICIACALFDRMEVDHFVCSPLPLADGSIYCAHGHIPSPAPAVLELLEGVSVVPFAGQGETITPTAIALLKTFKAEFGLWPTMTIEKKALVYGSKIFPNVANGAIWALGCGHGLV